MSHIKSHEALESRKYACDLCQLSFPRSDHYRLHMRKKHETEIIHNESIKDKSDVEIENVIILNDPNDDVENKGVFVFPSYFDTTCDNPDCDTNFETYEQMRDHYLQIHSIEHGWVKCCNMKFKWLGNIKSHVAWHDNPQIYK